MAMCALAAALPTGGCELIANLFATRNTPPQPRQGTTGGGSGDGGGGGGGGGPQGGGGGYGGGY
jgi:hypothetical protein